MASLPSEVHQKTHQDPFIHLLQKDLSEKQLLKLYNTDQRFKGMIELYSIFRELIALEKLTEDKESRFTSIYQTMDSMTMQLTEAFETQKFIESKISR